MPDFFLISGLFLGFAAIARMMVPGHTVLPYLFPAAALGLLIGTLFDGALALFISFLLAVLVGIPLLFTVLLPALPIVLLAWLIWWLVPRGDRSTATVQQ